MTPQTMDLVVALQVALEELGLMKERPAADLARGPEYGGDLSTIEPATTGGDIVGGTSEIERYPSVSVNRL